MSPIVTETFFRYSVLGYSVLGLMTLSNHNHTLFLNFEKVTQSLGSKFFDRFVHKSGFICALRSSRVIQPSELRANKDYPLQQSTFCTNAKESVRSHFEH
jgi:hypothetical protein